MIVSTMSIISRNKEKLVGILKYLNDKPGFRRVFYWIHEIRCNPFKPKGFMAVQIDNNFLLGVYNPQSSPTWRRMVSEGFEKSETEIVKSLVPFFNVFIDIGGHVGYFTCLVGSQNPEMPIIVFEPNPINYKVLIKNVEINKLKNVKALNVGLSEQAGEAILFGNDGGGSIEPKAFTEEPKDKVSVKVEKLDSYISYIPKGKSVFIKIDVEVLEYSVFKGGIKFIESTRPVGIIAEIVLHWSGGTNPHFKDTFNLLHKLGYTSFLVGDLPIKQTGNIDDLDGANYLFIRNDMVKNIKSNLKNIFA